MKERCRRTNSRADFPLIDPTEYTRLGELPFMEAKGQAGLHFIGKHPEEFLLLSARRCFKYWTDPDEFVWLPLSLMAWLGAAAALSHKRLDALPYALVLLVFPTNLLHHSHIQQLSASH